MKRVIGIIVFMVAFLTSCTDMSFQSGEHEDGDLVFREFLISIDSNKWQDESFNERRTSNTEESLILISNDSKVYDVESQNWELVESGYELDDTTMVLKNEFNPFLLKQVGDKTIYFESPVRVSFGSLQMSEYQKSDGSWHVGIPSDFSEIIDNVVCVKTLNGYCEIAVDKPAVYELVDRSKCVAGKFTTSEGVEIRKSNLLSSWVPISQFNGHVEVGDQVRIITGNSAEIVVFKGNSVIVKENSSLSSSSQQYGTFAYGEDGNEKFIGCGTLVSPVIGAVYGSPVLQINGSAVLSYVPRINKVTPSDIFVDHPAVGEKMKATPDDYTIHNNYYRDRIEVLAAGFVDNIDNSEVARELAGIIMSSEGTSVLRQRLNQIYSIYYPDWDPMEHQWNPDQCFYWAESERMLFWEVARIGNLREDAVVEGYYQSISQDDIDLVVSVYNGRHLVPTMRFWDFMLPNMNDRSELDLDETLERTIFCLENANQQQGILVGLSFMAWYYNWVYYDYLGALMEHECPDGRCDFESEWNEDARSAHMVAQGALWGSLATAAAWETGPFAAFVGALVSGIMGLHAGDEYDRAHPRSCLGNHPGFDDMDDPYGSDFGPDPWCADPIVGCGGSRFP